MPSNELIKLPVRYDHDDKLHGHGVWRDADGLYLFEDAGTAAQSDYGITHRLTREEHIARNQQVADAINKPDLAATARLDSDWYPIDTAELDGYRVLLWPYGDEVVIGYWDRDPEDEGGQCWRALDGERIEPLPTYWRQCPSGPSFAQIRADTRAAIAALEKMPEQQEGK